MVDEPPRYGRVHRVFFMMDQWGANHVQTNPTWWLVWRLTSNDAKMSKCVNDGQGVLQWWDMEAAPTAPETIEPTVLRKAATMGGLWSPHIIYFTPKNVTIGAPNWFSYHFRGATRTQVWTIGDQHPVFLAQKNTMITCFFITWARVQTCKDSGLGQNHAAYMAIRRKKYGVSLATNVVPQTQNYVRC